MESMTGFGASYFTLEGIKFYFSLRSINSRYFELTLNFPPEFRWFEARAESMTRKKITRGKIEVILEFEGELPKESDINTALIDSYSKALSTFYHKRNVQIPLDVLVQLPGVFEMKSRAWREMGSRFEFYFARALLKMERQRKKEGKRIQTWMKGRVRLLSRQNQKLHILHERHQKKAEKYARDKLYSILSGSSSQVSPAFLRKIWVESRDEILELYQADITEEIERLAIHLPELLNTIETGVAPGKKIEFYLQEVLREVNTLTSKTRDAEINRLGISMKVEIEKLREQVRNIV